MTGNFARGTGCCGVTSCDFGWYSRIVGGLNSGSRPSAGRGRICPGACCPPPAAATATPTTARSTRSRVFIEAFAASRKPNSVRLRALRRFGVTIIPLAPPSLAGSSDRPGSHADGPSKLPYLVLLRAGFCLPRVLPRARCALTAPFHHCHPSLPLARRRRVRLCVFCATVL